MTMSGSWLRTDEAGRTRCWWAGESGEYRAYHDLEWGRPVVDDRRLFEKISLEGFQSGLSWLTILRKREAFREAFLAFDPVCVARLGSSDVERLMNDSQIVRNRKKIEATIANARCAVETAREFGSLAAYVWSFEPGRPHRPHGAECPIPSTSPASAVLSKDLKARGWRFVGPTTAYAFMQAMGLVNDHVEGCLAYEVVEEERRALRRPEPPRSRLAAP